MSEELNDLNDEEKLKAENDFLKMKMMLEYGAVFGDDKENLSAEIENEFLNHIIAFEEQASKRKKIKVFDRIGQPKHFKPVAEIPDEEIENQYQSIIDHLNEHNIDLGVCSPNVSTRELYRFVVEELFEYEMDDMHLPGCFTNFIYDEFHPDPVYDNSRAAVDDCVKLILCKSPLNWTPCFQKDQLQLNHHCSLSEDDFKNLVNRFKDAYDDIENCVIENVDCTIEVDDCFVTGTYEVTLTLQNETTHFNGRWSVQFKLVEDFGFWYITNVQIESIQF